MLGTAVIEDKRLAAGPTAPTERGVAPPRAHSWALQLKNSASSAEVMHTTMFQYVGLLQTRLDAVRDPLGSPPGAAAAAAERHSPNEHNGRAMIQECLQNVFHGFPDCSVWFQLH